MDNEAYRLEEAVLFNRYGIIGYRTDSIDDCPDVDSIPVNPDLSS